MFRRKHAEHQPGMTQPAARLFENATRHKNQTFPKFIFLNAATEFPWALLVLGVVSTSQHDVGVGLCCSGPAEGNLFAVPFSASLV